MIVTKGTSHEFARDADVGNILSVLNNFVSPPAATRISLIHLNMVFLVLALRDFSMLLNVSVRFSLFSVALMYPLIVLYVHWPMPFPYFLNGDALNDES